jgi:hypothetical protein
MGSVVELNEWNVASDAVLVIPAILRTAVDAENTCLSDAE